MSILNDIHSVFKFEVQATKGSARAGLLHTPHGVIETPVFMPVGTNATVKWLTREQIKSIGSQIILANTYHLYLRPSSDLVEEFGGLHEFMNIDLPMLTDSGGFQVFSLGNPRDGDNMVKIDDEWVEFRSHLNGDKHYFTPEKAVQIQDQLGADIIMAFDDVVPGNSSKTRAKQALDRTHRWAVQGMNEWVRLQKVRQESGKHLQAYFPIVQGVVYEDLRKESVRFLRELETPGIAIGWLSVGEWSESMYRMLDVLEPELPEQKPHYLMWVGTPENLEEAIKRWVDMFDCVLPTRLGRHGEVYSAEGDLKLRQERFKHSKNSIPCVDGVQTYVSKNYTMGYLRHLIVTGEMTGQVLLSMHNLEYLIQLTKKIRKEILDR